jgi:hypothetical protein
MTTRPAEWMLGNPESQQRGDQPDGSDLGRDGECHHQDHRQPLGSPRHRGRRAGTRSVDQFRDVIHALMQSLRILSERLLPWFAPETSLRT